MERISVKFGTTTGGLKRVLVVALAQKQGWDPGLFHYVIDIENSTVKPRFMRYRTVRKNYLST